MNTIQVEIIAEGMAKECNPLGDEPIKSFDLHGCFNSDQLFISEHRRWSEAESQTNSLLIAMLESQYMLEKEKFAVIIDYTLEGILEHVPPYITAFSQKRIKDLERQLKELKG